MGILRSILEHRSHPSNPSDRILQLFGGGRKSYTGRYINTEQAMKYPVFHACVRVIASAGMSVPWFTYGYSKDGKKQLAKDFALYPLLHDQPHPYWTSAEFVEFMFVCLLTNGNFFAVPTRNKKQEIEKITPIHPDKIRIEYVQLSNGETKLVFYYTEPGGKEIPLFLGTDIWYVRGMTLDGVTGVSPIKYLMEGIGLGLAGEEFGARLFGNGASPRGVLVHPKVLNAEKSKELREQFERTNGGLENANRVVVLEEGMKFEPIALKADEAQFLETRKHQRSEIAGAMMVQPHKIGDHEHATFSNIEQQNIEFVQSTMLPWFRRIEQSARRDLLTAQEKLLYSIEFKLDGLLRGDIKTRYEAYGLGRQWGFLCGNDIRELENMEPFDGGDEFWRPAGVVPVGTPVEVPKATRSENPHLNALAEIVQDRRDYDAIIKELRNVTTDAIQRALSKESKALIRQIDKVQKGGTWKEFQSWTDEFYNTFRSEMKTTLLPAARAIQAISVSGVEDIEPILTNLVDHHAKRSVDLLGEMFSQEGATSLKLQQMREQVDLWKESRRQELLDLLEERVNGN